MAYVVAHTEKVYLSGVKQPTVIFTHAQQRHVERFSLRVNQLEVIVAFMSVWLVGRSAPMLYQRCRLYGL